MGKYFQYTQLFIFSIGIFVLSCKEDIGSKQIIDNSSYETLFTKVDSKESGIGFINEIPENSAMNSMVYEYFYNGGGVAIGDINNDNLVDVYFTSNLKSNKLYLNKGDFKFEDITESAMVKGSFGWTTGVTMIDINADGWLDIYVCKSGKGKAKNRENELFINNRNGSFTEQAKQYGLNFSGYSTQAAFFDYDKDGDLDMYLLNHNVTPINTNNPEEFKHQVNELVGDKFFRNDNGKFVDISVKAGLIRNALGFGLGVSIGDLNQDGWPDIYVANDYIEQDYLYYNNTDGTFTEALKTSLKHISNFSMGTEIADFNNDGLLDIMSLDMVAEDNYSIKTSMSAMSPEAFNHAVNNGFHYQYMYNAMQLNNGGEKFSEIAQLSGISSTDWSWSPLFADFDNDGLKDLFISNGLKRDFRNNDFRNRKLKRLEQAQKNGEKMSKVVEELVFSTPQRKTINYVFKNNGDLTFTKSSKDWGITDPTFSNGVAYADLDNDGDLDLVINNIDEEASILKNNTNKNYIQFKFKGNKENSFGIGTRVELQTRHSKQVVENYPTRGYQSSVEPLIHIGLGDIKIVDKAIITWPDGKVQVLESISVNERLVIDYKDAVSEVFKDVSSKPTMFKNITEEYDLSHKHIENVYDDFKIESLLPHKMSQFGPALAVGDVNDDGLDDFYIGGAKDYPASMYIQNINGGFLRSNLNTWNLDMGFEDVDAQFFDADNDGDLDLYVVSGGNEWPVNHNKYQDRLYINNNGKFYKSESKLPQIGSSGSCVKQFDFDNDGDLDLFVGSRLLPQQYPHPGRSYLLENNNGIFKDVTESKAPQLINLGLTTDAVWMDIDNDDIAELIVVGEWMPITILKINKSVFEITDMGLQDTNGWWNSVEAADMDNDGDIDFLVGNLGLNYKYKASITEPFEVYANDFDDNGTNDIVLGYYNQGDLFPLRGRECSSGQMPFIKQKFPTYDSFGAADLSQVYGKEKLEGALHLNAKTFSSVYLENIGNGKFNSIELPKQAQLSSINDIIIDDFDADFQKDILIAGNFYASEVETPRNDASIGLVLKNIGNDNLIALTSEDSGISIDGDVKKLKVISIGKDQTKAILVAKNNDLLELIITNNE